MNSTHMCTYTHILIHSQKYTHTLLHTHGHTTHMLMHTHRYTQHTLIQTHTNMQHTQHLYILKHNRVSYAHTHRKTKGRHYVDRV